jgi:hypothetical protein
VIGGSSMPPKKKKGKTGSAQQSSSTKDERAAKVAQPTSPTPQLVTSTSLSGVMVDIKCMSHLPVALLTVISEYVIIPDYLIMITHAQDGQSAYILHASNMTQWLPFPILNRLRTSSQMVANYERKATKLYFRDHNMALASIDIDTLFKKASIIGHDVSRAFTYTSTLAKSEPSLWSITRHGGGDGVHVAGLRHQMVGINDHNIMLMAKPTDEVATASGPQVLNILYSHHTSSSSPSPQPFIDRVDESSRQIISLPSTTVVAETLLPSASVDAISPTPTITSSTFSTSSSSKKSKQKLQKSAGEKPLASLESWPCSMISSYVAVFPERKSALYTGTRSQLVVTYNGSLYCWLSNPSQFTRLLGACYTPTPISSSSSSSSGLSTTGGVVDPNVRLIERLRNVPVSPIQFGYAIGLPSLGVLFLPLLDTSSSIDGFVGNVCIYDPQSDTYRMLHWELPIKWLDYPTAGSASFGPAHIVYFNGYLLFVTSQWISQAVHNFLGTHCYWLHIQSILDTSKSGSLQLPYRVTREQWIRVPNCLPTPFSAATSCLLSV